MILHPGASAKVTQDDQPGCFGLHIRHSQTRSIDLRYQSCNKVVHHLVLRRERGLSPQHCFAMTMTYYVVIHAVVQELLIQYHC